MAKQSSLQCLKPRNVQLMYPMWYDTHSYTAKKSSNMQLYFPFHIILQCLILHEYNYLFICNIWFSSNLDKTINMFFQKNLKRPTIPAEYGSKVPISVRQRYLNTIIDECLPLYQKEEDAFKRVSLYSNTLYQKIVLWEI